MLIQIVLFDWVIFVPIQPLLEISGSWLKNSTISNILKRVPKNNAKVTDSKKAISILPPDYSWKTYGAMNVMFWNNHQKTSLEEAKKLLAKSHAEVIKLIESYSNNELFMPKHFAWTGNAALGDYCVSTTSSHYDWAIKKIKAHIKNCKLQD